MIAGLASLSLAAASPGAVTTIGSNLRMAASAAEGICPLGPGSTSFPCADAQTALLATHQARGGLTAPVAGTLVRWRVRSGPASAGTASVQLRLRTLDGPAVSPFFALPLAEPGVHDFPAGIPVERGDRLALEAVVRGTGSGPAYAPVVGLEPGVGTIAEWSPPVGAGLGIPASATREGAELLLNADLDTDRSPPRTKLTYPQRQDFLATKEVLVRFRCSEDATAFASGQLEFPNGKRGSVIYGLYGKRRAVEAGEKTALRLRLPRKTWEAALRADANGKRIVVKVTVSAEDSLGNASGATVAAIRPKR